MHAAEELKEAAIDFIVQNSATVLKVNSLEDIYAFTFLISDVSVGAASSASKVGHGGLPSNEQRVEQASSVLRTIGQAS